MYIFYDYKSDNVALEPSSTKAPYSPAAVKTDFLSDLFKFEGNSGTLSFDMLSPVTMDSIGLSSNISSTGLVKIKGGNTSGSYDEEITLSGILDNQIIFQQFKPMTYRYWELELSDASIVDISIGRFALGESMKLNDMKPQPVISFKTTGINYTSNSGQSYGVKGYDFTIVNLSWPELSVTEKDALKIFVETVQNYKPFFIEFNCLEQSPIYARLDADLALTRSDIPGTFTAALTVREVF